MGPDSREEAPLVSVVLPTYDRPEMVAMAVESVADQTYPNYELIVVDDASPSAVEPVVADIAPPSLRWRCLRHETNQGANAARNTGIEAADGDIIAFLDDDDRWLPEKLAVQVAALEDGGEDVGVALVGQQFVTDGEPKTVRLPDLDGDATVGLLTDGTGGSFSTIAVERWVVEAAGKPDERFPIRQDREWLLRLSLHCKFVTIRRPLIVRRFGEYERISNTFEAFRDRTYPLFLEKHRTTAAAQGCEDRFVASLSLGVARKALANGYYHDARRFALIALRTGPRSPAAYLTALLALGGQYTYTPAVRLKRLVDRINLRPTGTRN